MKLAEEENIEPEIIRNCTVEIQGVVKKSALNGLRGKVVAFNQDKQRWVFKRKATDEGILLKPENLKFISA